MPAVSVTVAVCTWNRCALLRQTLEHLSRITIPAGVDFDVLVVNNNCTDATDAVLDEFQARIPLRRVFETQAGVVHARNAALSSTTADYVAFLDDDAFPDASWLVELVAATRAFPSATVIGGAIGSWFAQPPDPDLAEAFYWLRSGFCGLDYERAPGPLPDGLIVHGPNMALRTAALGGLRFNPAFGGTPASTMGGDEHDLFRRIRAAGGSVIWWPAMRVSHVVLPARTTLGYCLRFSADKGRERVFLEPHTSSGPVLFGAPRWLWRRWLETGAGSIVCALAPKGRPIGPDLLSGRADVPASKRIRSLTWRRELAFLTGMILAHRQRVRESVLTSSRGAHR